MTNHKLKETNKTKNTRINIEKLQIRGEKNTTYQKKEKSTR